MLWRPERGLAAVQAWQEAFGDRVRFVFWDLFGRQVHDRLAGQHIGGGRYHHPVFNDADVVGRFPGADIVDLSPLLGAPMHEVRRLFIDSSCHPSQIGYLLLNDALCAGRAPVEAFRSAVANVEAELFALAGKIVGAKGGAVLLTGRSVWLDTLMAYMGKDCALRLARSGLVLAPLTRLPGQPSIAQMLQQVPLSLCAPVLVSAGAQDLSPQLARAFDTDPSFWRDVPCIDWETATAAVITARRETPRYAYAREDAPQRPDHAGAGRAYGRAGPARDALLDRVAPSGRVHRLRPGAGAALRGGSPASATSPDVRRAAATAVWRRRAGDAGTAA